MSIKDDLMQETAIIKGTNCTIAFKFNMEFRIKQSKTSTKLKEQYYADKNKIIK
jgi:hypothetical protein